MLYGKGSQYWMTSDYEDKRRKALVDRSKYSNTVLEDADVLNDIRLGGGTTDDDSYEIKQFPFPLDPSIKSRKTLDLRKEDPRTGGD